MALKLANNAVSSLAGLLSSSATSLAVMPGDGEKFPSLAAEDWFPLTIVRDDVQFEIVKCTARSFDTLTIERGQEGTQPLEFDPGSRIELRATEVVYRTIFDDLALKANQSDLSSAIPTGIIALWTGAVDAVPAGWALCNGDNGTPNLTNRFIIAAGGTYAVGATGGGSIPSHSHGAGTLAAASAGSHGHTASTGSAGSHGHSASSNSTGAHTHGVAPRAASGGSQGPGFSSVQAGTTLSTGSGGGHSHSISVGSGGAHTHTVSVTAGGAHTHTVSGTTGAAGSGSEVIAKYYALAYIMKL